ncbi:MAG: 50S ribosomal protein L30 [Eubacteriales bacterium]|nr:50S ribosomal protein L30 [Eubacteriales bacterium]
MAKKEQKMLKVTYVRSAIGYNKKQAKILEALGLTKLNQTKLLPDNESVRGSIFHVKHLVNVEEV